MGLRTNEGDERSPFEDGVISIYGQAQVIERLPEGFAYYAGRTNRGVLVHKLCERVLGLFEEHTTQAQILQAAEDHWCSGKSQGIGAG